MCAVDLSHLPIHSTESSDVLHSLSMSPRLLTLISPIHLSKNYIQMQHIWLQLCLWHCPSISLHFNSPKFFLMGSFKISFLSHFIFSPSSPFPCHHLSPDSSNGLLCDDLYVWSFPFLSVYPETVNPVHLSETSYSYIISLF